MDSMVVHCKQHPYDVYIGRPSKWGNPFVIGKDGSRQEVIKKYADWIQTQPELLAQVHELRGKVLGCWCAPQPCHGDILVALANQKGNTTDMVERAANQVTAEWCDVCMRPAAECVCYKFFEDATPPPGVVAEGPVVSAWPESTKESSVRMCAELTKKGVPCKNRAMEGSDYCGPHRDVHAKLNTELESVPAVIELELPPAPEMTPAKANVIERAQATPEPDLFIVAGTGSRSIQTLPTEKKAQIMEWLTARLTRAKDKYGDKLVVMSGMAEGFDLALAIVALRLDIKLWVALPSKDYGDYYYGKNSLTKTNRLPLFEDIIAKAWRVTEVMPSPKGSDKYNNRFGSANFDRNDFMVEQADAFLVYDPTSTGTQHCFKAIQAKEQAAGRRLHDIVPVVQ